MKLGFIIPILAIERLVYAFKNEAIPKNRIEMYLDVRSSSATSLSADECSDPAYGQCSFYPDCLEARYRCGPNGYPIGYGLKYCEKFLAACSTFSTQGQTWIMNTMKCLEDVLIPEATGGVGAVKTCDELKDKAFNSHAGCYLDNGVCSLPPSDWIAIVDVLGLEAILSSWEATEGALETADGCLKFFTSLVVQKLL